MLDLPAPLVGATLSWIACDDCGGDGWSQCEDLDCAILSHRHPCRRSHVVVTFEGCTIHADPDRVRQECDQHDSVDEACGLTWPNCRPVLRPVVPIDLGEA